MHLMRGSFLGRSDARWKCIRHMLGIYTNIRTKHPSLSQICRTVPHLSLDRSMVWPNSH